MTKYSKTQWLDTIAMEPLYGIKAKPDGEDFWLNVCEDSKPLFYRTKAERDAKLKELKKTEKLRKNNDDTWPP